MLRNRIRRFALPPWLLLGRALHTCGHAVDSAHVTLPLHAMVAFGHNEPTHFSSSPPAFLLVSNTHCTTNPLTTLARYGSTKQNYPANPLINLSVYHSHLLSKRILPYLLSSGYGPGRGPGLESGLPGSGIGMGYMGLGRWAGVFV